MENKDTILELYENAIDNIYKSTVENSSYTNEIIKNEEELEKTLTKEQKEKLEQINEYHQKRNEEIFKEIWISAYSKATKLIVEGLKE